MTEPAGRRAAVESETDTAIADIEQQFTLLFSRVRSDMRENAARFHPEIGVLGYSIIAVLSHAESMRPGEIARELNLDKGAMSRQATELERLGLLEREADPADHRSVRLRLSPGAATRMLEERSRRRSATYDQFSRWDLVDLRRLAELVGRVNEMGPERG
jgi:DNA-binding MarR family transcriptional regulator